MAKSYRKEYVKYLQEVSDPLTYNVFVQEYKSYVFSYLTHHLEHKTPADQVMTFAKWTWKSGSALTPAERVVKDVSPIVKDIVSALAEDFDFASKKQASLALKQLKSKVAALKVEDFY